MKAADLQDYIGVIDKMKQLINSTEFDQVFTMLTNDLPKSKQFLLKMELKRISQPCDYFIDLRGRVAGEVRPYVFRDKTYYMDDNAISIFEAGLKQYGNYTVGLYEEVMNTDNNYRVMHRKETEQRIQEALATASQQSDEEQDNFFTPDMPVSYVKVITFSQYPVRQEERMHYGIDIDIDYQGVHFAATTSDLSVSGCRVKVAKDKTANTGEQVKVQFKALSQEYVLEQGEGVPYQILEIENGEKHDYWRLQRLNTEEDEKLTQFLKKFIDMHKRRYKVNLNSTLDAVLTKGYEQFYIPRLNTLPVFFSVEDNRAIPKCALITDANRACWQYFQDEHHQSVLISILSGKRLKQLARMAADEKSTILYSFTHIAKGKIYFYSATKDELAESATLRELFLGFGTTKHSWRIFHCTLLRTSAANSAALPSIPEAQNKQENQFSAQVDNFIQHFRYIIGLTDITSETVTEHYKHYIFDQQQLSQLSGFANHKLQHYPLCEAIPVKYVNLRAESRYLYKTAVVIDAVTQAGIVTGFSRDFSPKGLQVETYLPVSLKKGDIVQLALPELQRISNKYNLKALPYEVMAVSKSGTILNLKADETDDLHIGKQFFQQLIQNNRHKLVQAEESAKYPGLATALRNMYVKALNSFVFYLNRKGIRCELNVVARGRVLHPLHKLLLLFSPAPDKLNMELLLKNHNANLQFANQLKQMRRLEKAKEYELFIRLGKPDESGITEVQSHYDYEFESEQLKYAFIKDALEHGVLFCFRIFLSRVGRPDTDHIAKELNYISVYAIHKAKILEDELWSVAGMGEVVDISSEIAFRYGKPELEDEQQKLRQQLLDQQQNTV